MDIYIKPPKKASMIGRAKVLIEDITEVIATKDVADKVKKLSVLDIEKIDNRAENQEFGKKGKGQKKSDKSFYLIPVTEIVKVIKKAYPDISVQNLGEMDTIIEYKKEKTKEKPYLKWIKISFVTLTLFIGSLAAIMSFHTDSEMSTVLENFYFILFRVRTDSPLLVEIPYSIGLAFGIIVFFNHFLGRRITTDLTPIEVEMPGYEKNVNDAIIDKLGTIKQEEEEIQNDNS
ncbi:MAG: stage V sporulation protein AA [Defluviitaleaceae bacterium]|nr:stage V sporulation protein AA [Defluviitaleaceae bacterium]